jgi:hypothetical protein
MVIYRVVRSSMAHPGRLMSFWPNLAELAALTIYHVLTIVIIVLTFTTLCSLAYVCLVLALLSLQSVVRRDYLVLPSVFCTQYSMQHIIQAEQCSKAP